MARLCIFDCDGTLVDSQHAIIAAMQSAFVASGLAAPSDDAIRHVVGLSLPDAVLALVPATATTMSREIVVAYRSAVAQLRRPNAACEPLYPGVIEALDGLAAEGWILGIATGKSHPALMATLDEHGLAGRFLTLQTADRVPGKPAPDMVLRAMAETGAALEKTVVVGDTVYDVLMARRAGTAAIGVAWGYHPATALAAAGACEVAESFAELVRYLRAWANGASASPDADR